MTLLIYCLASICSLSISSINYNEHSQAIAMESMKKMYQVNKDYAKFIETSIKTKYNKDLALLLDHNVYDVVTPTLLSIKRAIDKAEKEGTNSGDCYMRTEELMETEAKNVFDQKLRGCLETYISHVHDTLQKIPIIMNEMANIMIDVSNARSECSNANYPITCVKGKILHIKLERYDNVTRDLDNVWAQMMKNYNKTLEDAYDCTADMRASLDDITEFALKQGLGCVDNPEIAEYKFSEHPEEY